MTALHSTAACTYQDREHPAGCGWDTQGPRSDQEAEKHTKDTGHGTTVRTTPIERAPAARPIERQEQS